MNAEAVAIPLSLVVATVVFVFVSVKVPLGPEAGAANVTVAPLTGLPVASIT